MALLRKRNVMGRPDTLHTLVEHYSGNPLALNLVASVVNDYYGGNIDAYIQYGASVFDDIRTVLENQQAIDGEKLPFEVEKMADGTIKIALMEGKSALMFSVGSAKPTKAMILALRDVASKVMETGKKVSVLGHTDGRPYRGKDYDNWRLSTARAHMARYVLIDGGLADERFERVEGHADRTLKYPDNPFASGNRRIELILRSE